MADAKILNELLGKLPFGPIEDYRGNLRVVAGAAERLRARAARLLGEKD